MGFVRVKAILGNPERSKLKQVTFLADSGSYYTVIPQSLAEEVGIKPLSTRKLVMADKREVEVNISGASVEAVDREAIVLAAIMDTPEPLLGAETLEALGLAIDVTTGELKPMRPYAVLL